MVVYWPKCGLADTKLFLITCFLADLEWLPENFLMERLKDLRCDHSCMLESYPVVMLTGRSYVILVFLVYFSQRKWAAHASYSLSAFHSSCGMKNLSVPRHRISGWFLGKWLYFYKVLFSNKNYFVKLNSWLLQFCCITLTSDQYSLNCFSLSSLSLSDVTCTGNLH